MNVFCAKRTKWLSTKRQIFRFSTTTRYSWASLSSSGSTCSVHTLPASTTSSQLLDQQASLLSYRLEITKELELVSTNLCSAMIKTWMFRWFHLKMSFKGLQILTMCFAHFCPCAVCCVCESWGGMGDGGRSAGTEWMAWRYKIGKLNTQIMNII